MAAELKELELEQQALSWPERAKQALIKDQASYDYAASLRIDIASLEREIVDYHKPLKKAADEAHKAICKAENRLLEPLKQAKVILNLEIAAWTQAQERIRFEAERKAQELAHKQEEEARLALAMQAEEMGATEETAQEILETPLAMPAVVVQPTFNKLAGVSTSQRWRAEVVDLKALCRAVIEGKASIELIQPNTTALNTLARAMKGTLNIPGVKAVPETAVIVRR
jgi:hypothetical protein